MDDFAFRRGTRYGTVLVDLERHALVDVLPDRSADTFARWLSEHPGVEVVSRDRGGEYAEAARRVVPDAVQVADRFHLLKNLRDVVSRVFRQHAEVLELVPTPDEHLQRLTNLRLDREASKERTREQTREPLRIHPRPFEEGHEERPGGQRARDTSPHRGEVPGLQDPATETAFHQEGQRHRTLRGLHPGALGVRAAATRHKSGRRSPSRATPVPTRT